MEGQACWGRGGVLFLFLFLSLLVIIIIKRRSGINPIPPTVKDRDYKTKE